MADFIVPVRIFGAAVLVSSAACVQTPAPATPIMVSSQTTVVAGESADETAPAPVPTGASRSVLVLVDKRVDRPTEVVGVLDFHSNAQSEDKGFEELRQRAATLGADAVLGAELEHGVDGELSHLSGMAVRFLDH